MPQAGAVYLEPADEVRRCKNLHLQMGDHGLHDVPHVMLTANREFSRSMIRMLYGVLNEYSGGESYQV
jgi:hypothetical protein